MQAPFTGQQIATSSGNNQNATVELADPIPVVPIKKKRKRPYVRHNTAYWNKKKSTKPTKRKR